jgi:hypothetical protein
LLQGANNGKEKPQQEMKIVDAEQKKESTKSKFAPSEVEDKNNMLLRASLAGKIAMVGSTGSRQSDMDQYTNVAPRID